ncbi:nicotinate-nucleotide-dimethylbenzimidazole phosphoribosyltransferase [Breoghania corrubedonensis]|uniref:Nicotinate-nucleotide--dimethylbenzimidazole phosphoribosyltransferase n=1 Tax=Breoghania corrubedonensis TaxID=665038 RepID=A0A2T5V1C6_9HYPH|nr:nicotinate-nucleotide--dimethylbenzimidazole phosphoribosyltransferase [Breoghania corrubedonensis]PTW57564.1 nicotinate-nucleotide-dimethylbenzimidazole phosphoribosyltransferase [Breoghania corrubedonensis]
MPQTPTGLPFDDIRNLIPEMLGPDTAAVKVVREREAHLTKPAGSLGRMEEIVEWLAAWQGAQRPKVTRPLVAVFAGNHGVTDQGIAPFPREVTHQMVANFAAGGAAINQICIAYDLGLKVFELALELPTGDITIEDAMDEKTCAATIAYGMEAVAGGIDLLAIGEMGIGNTTIAAAIMHGLFGGEARDWVGPGTGLNAEGVARKAEVIAKAVARNKGALKDPLEVLRRLGGREIAAMAGAILAGRMQRVPVIVDGYVATSAAAILYAMDPGALDHCLFGHVSAEPAHRRALEIMGKRPLLDLGMRLGEGTGAAMAMGIVKAAAQTHDGMATFADAGVSVSE